MKLIKYCKEEHNLTKGCLTIQLGTPGYYRELDPAVDKIADQHEGSYRLDPITDLENGIVYTKPRAFVPNCYIFCVSTEEVEPNTINESYNSRYNITDPKKFYDSLAQLLVKQLELSDFTETCQSKIIGSTGLPDVTIQVIGGSDTIEYESVANIESTLHLADIECFAKHYKNIVFTKNDRFSPNKEVRFAFVVHHSKHGILSVKPKPKLLQISSKLVDCLREC